MLRIVVHVTNKVKQSFKKNSIATMGCFPVRTKKSWATAAVVMIIQNPAGNMTSNQYDCSIIALCRGIATSQYT